MSEARILVAEDDENIRIGLVDTLESEGYVVDPAVNGEQAVALFNQRSYDLALLDIMMPVKDGYSVCQDIRAKDKRIGIIMLTAKSQEIDKVLGLKLGADDYVTKPFGVQELLARVEAALRRLQPAEDTKQVVELPAVLEFEEFSVNRKTYKAASESGELALTSREVKLFEQFYERTEEVLTRDELLNAVWGIDYFGTTRTLDQHIAQLRKKLSSIGVEGFIETVHGIGYRRVG